MIHFEKPTYEQFLRSKIKIAPDKGIEFSALNIVHVFEEDAKNILDGLSVKYIKNQAEAERTEQRVLITDYEWVRDGDIRSDYFTAVTLDERLVFRSVIVKRQFIKVFLSPCIISGFQRMNHPDASVGVSPSYLL